MRFHAGFADRAVTGRAERIAALVLAVLLGLLGLSVPLELVGVSATRLAPWRDLLASAATREATLHTLIAGSASAVLATVLGGGFALLAGLTDLSRRRALSFLFLLLMVIPGQISVIAWIALTGPESPILTPLGLAPARGAPVLLFGPGGIIFLMGVEHAPIVFLALSGFLRALPAELIEAAASAGANSLRILTRILLPLARPAFAAGLSGAFAAGIANFATPALLGIPGRYLMLTTLIFQRLTGFGPSALGVVTALSALLALFCIAAVALERALVPAVAFSAAPRTTPPFVLGRWRLPVEAASWLMLTVLLFLPLVALLAAAATRAYGQQFGFATMSLVHFRTVLFEEAATRRAFLNSTLLALLAGLLLALTAIAGAHRAEAGSRLVRWAMAAAELPYVLPGTALGIGCILLFLRPILGISLYDTLAILLIAYLMRFFALARRPVQAMLRTLDPALEETAASLGAGYVRRLARVIVPALIPAAAAGALLVILSAFSELTISVLLWSQGNETIGVMIFNLEQAGELGAAAALSTLAVLVTLLLLGAAALIARGRTILPWQF